MKQSPIRKAMTAALALACLGGLTACSTGKTYYARLPSGEAAQMILKPDGRYSLAALRTDEEEGCRRTSKQSVTGDYEGADPFTLYYTTRYEIVTYGPLGGDAGDLRRAAEAYNDAKPVQEWKVENPVGSKASGSMELGGGTLYYNDDSRTLAYEYTTDAPQSLQAKIYGDEFSITGGSFPLESAEVTR